jgi:hypothetical protein
MSKPFVIVEAVESKRLSFEKEMDWEEGMNLESLNPSVSFLEKQNKTKNPTKKHSTQKHF